MDRRHGIDRTDLAIEMSLRAQLIKLSVANDRGLALTTLSIFKKFVSTDTAAIIQWDIKFSSLPKAAELI